jgi:F-type H+-transporting ATPase subunit epsilon
MDIQIISPVHSVFSGSVDSVLVPGKDGAFHMLNSHAPIVSVLGEGEIQIYTHNSTIDSDLLSKDFVVNAQDDKIFGIKIKGGIVELNKNQLIVLID